MLGLNAATGHPLAGLDHLRQSVRDILTTRIGTRVLRRDYGSELPALIDRPMTPALALDLYVATAQALRRWEPCLSLSKVTLTDARVGRIALFLEARYLPDGHTITLEGIVVEA